MADTSFHNIMVSKVGRIVNEWNLGADYVFAMKFQEKRICFLICSYIDGKLFLNVEK